MLCAFGLTGSLNRAHAQVAGIKTNLLYDATATVNLGVEVGLASKLSLDISGNLNLWTWKNNMKWKHWMVQPELRLWTCQRFAGHFFGVHALAGQFNVGNIPIPKDFRFLGVHFGALADTRYEGWGFGAGLAYGYALPANGLYTAAGAIVTGFHAVPIAVGYEVPIGKHWNLEAEIGIGALYGIANSFDCDVCNRPLAQNIRKFTPMLTKAAINIVYLF